jgi:hypothetical protein
MVTTSLATVAVGNCGAGAAVTADAIMKVAPDRRSKERCMT